MPRLSQLYKTHQSTVLARNGLLLLYSIQADAGELVLEFRSDLGRGMVRIKPLSARKPDLIETSPNLDRHLTNS